eukprot:6172120-Pleurochrysis_carterae.AAC.1
MASRRRGAPGSIARATAYASTAVRKARLKATETSDTNGRRASAANMPSPGGVETFRVPAGAAVEGGAAEGGSACGAAEAASKTGSEARAAGIVP